MEPEEPEVEEENEEMRAARYRRNLAMACTKHVLGRIGVEDAIISCPKSDTILTERGPIKIHRFHSSATYTDHDEWTIEDGILDKRPVMGWSIRLWFDITMGARTRHKVVTKERGLSMIHEALIPLTSEEDFRIERLYLTYINTIHTLTPLIYCTLKPMRPMSFMPRMFEMNEKRRFSRVYCHAATSFAQWFLNYCRVHFG